MTPLRFRPCSAPPTIAWTKSERAHRRHRAASLSENSPKTVAGMIGSGSLWLGPGYSDRTRTESRVAIRRKPLDGGDAKLGTARFTTDEAGSGSVVSGMGQD